MDQLESDNRQERKDEDVIQSTIGNFGRWQFKLSLLMALLKIPIAWFQLNIVFLAPPTQFWCKPDERENSTSIWFNSTFFENVTLRREGLNTGFCEILNENQTKTSCINGYEYNRTIFHSSIVTEWNLVCENKRLVDMTQLTLMFGVLLGNIFFGVFADKKGRKKTLLICIILQTIFGIAAAWMTCFWGFVLVRFLMAFANGGTIVTSFVMCMEVVGGPWRTIVPILYQIPFGFGNSMMSAMAYFLRDWRLLQLALSLISAFYIFYAFVIPESPRWLIAVGRGEEALAILENAAKCNGMDVSKVHMAATALSNTTEDAKKKTKVSVLFTKKELRKRSILLCVNWLICGVTFYAFSQYMGKIGSNLYFTAAMSGFVALPGTIFCVYIVRHYGRRWTIASAHLLTALCFFGILFVPVGVYFQDWPRVAIAGVGIFGLSISMPALYLFSGELFPTTVRNAGVGVSIMFSRLGSMIAPLVIALQDVSSHLTLLILGAGAILEAVLILTLPETQGMPFPETINDLSRNKDKRVDENGNARSNKKENQNFITSPETIEEIL